MRLLAIPVLVALALTGCSSSDGDKPKADATTTASSPTPTTDPEGDFLRALQPLMASGSKQVEHASDTYLSDVQAGDLNAAAVSAALVGIEYANVADQVSALPNAGTTEIGTMATDTYGGCADNWSNAGRALLDEDTVVALREIKSCTGSLNDLAGAIHDRT